MFLRPTLLLRSPRDLPLMIERETRSQRINDRRIPFISSEREHRKGSLTIGVSVPSKSRKRAIRDMSFPPFRYATRKSQCQTISGNIYSLLPVNPLSPPARPTPGDFQRV